MTALTDRQIVTARRLDLYIHQGATYNHTWVYLDEAGAPINITGYTARLQIRATQAATTFLYEATTANGAITISGALGEVRLKIPAATLSAWTWTTGVYDLELEGLLLETDKLSWGRVRVKPEITR